VGPGALDRERRAARRCAPSLGAAGGSYPVAENFTEFTLGTTRLDGRKPTGPVTQVRTEAR
jgi:hypothetical protein